MMKYRNILDIKLSSGYLPFSEVIPEMFFIFMCCSVIYPELTKTNCAEKVIQQYNENAKY